MGNEKRMYVGNLDYSVDDSGLEELFSPYGTVESADVITDRASGRSKGFGFVEMSSQEEAQAAIDAVDGTEHEGRTLKVNKARPKT
mgnify:CR=1 FL=1